MKGWLIYNFAYAKENKSYINWFQSEAKKKKIDLQLIFREELMIGIIDGKYHATINGLSVALPDFVVNRTIDPLIQNIFNLLKIKTFNEANIADICNHKSKTHLELNKLNIPMMPTYFVRKDAPPSVLPLNFPFVVKEATGRSGKQIYYCTSEVEWQDALNKMKTDDIIIQSANVQLGKDLRVFVIGKEIIAAVLRDNENDFRANYKLGGKASLYTLSEQQQYMIQKIVNHFDFGLVGIDFLIGHNGEIIFNEIEDVVGSRILSEVSDINLLEKYVSYIKQKVTGQ